MSNINFVPDDYVQSNESRRANLMCLVLFSVVMAGLGGVFVTIKMRQRDCKAQEAVVSAKMTRMHESIQQYEEMQAKRTAMMKTALTTAELLEPVPRSILLASLTNSLPPEVSLTKLSMIQKEPKETSRPQRSRNKYQAAKAKNGKTAAGLTPKTTFETNMDIEGLAPSDVEVAEYMKRLRASVLLTDVALVESAEKTVENTSVRCFKLTAMVSPDVHLTKEDVNMIRSKAENSVYKF